jgi:hypothetical protein
MRTKIILRMQGGTEREIYDGETEGDYYAADALDILGKFRGARREQTTERIPGEVVDITNISGGPRRIIQVTDDELITKITLIID